MYFYVICFNTEEHRFLLSELTSNMYKDTKTDLTANVKGDGVDSLTRVLSIHGNGHLDVGDFTTKCYSNPAKCEHGFSVSLWMKYKGK